MPHPKELQLRFHHLFSSVKTIFFGIEKFNKNVRNQRENQRENKKKSKKKETKTKKKETKYRKKNKNKNKKINNKILFTNKLTITGLTSDVERTNGTSVAPYAVTEYAPTNIAHATNRTFSSKISS